MCLLRLRLYILELLVPELQKIALVECLCLRVVMLHFVFSGRYGELLWGCEVTIKFIYIQVRLVKCVNNQRFLA